MPRQNRIDPFGDLCAASAKGLLTGNRGRLMKTGRTLARHHQGNRWISCKVEFGSRKVPLDAPNRWTPVFFLDDAVALAAGHRPCGFCRLAQYRSFRAAVTRSVGSARPLGADELDTLLASERLRPGRGLERRVDRITHEAVMCALPAGTVIVVEEQAMLVLDDCMRPFAFEGWGDRVDLPSPAATVTVLTPRTSVAALRHGFVPEMHVSSSTGP
jgi:hypothetical protein